MSLIEQLKGILQTHGEVVIGAIIALAGTVIGTLISIVGKFFEHRWAAKRERVSEKKKSLDRLLTVADGCFRACSAYRGELIRQIVHREKITTSYATQLADEAERICTLYLPQCEPEVAELRIAEDAFTKWSLGLGEETLKNDRNCSSLLTEESAQDFHKHMQPLADAVSKLHERCARIAVKL